LAVFFTFGVMPTVAVSAWGVWRRSPWYVAGHAEQLTWRLGMDVRISGVRHPRPGVVVYEEIKVREPENRQPVFQCEEAEIRWNESPNGSNPSGLRLILSQPKINAAEWSEIWRLADQLLTGRAETDDLAVQVEATALDVVGHGLSQTLSQVLVRVAARAGGPQIEATFHLPDGQGEPARIVVARNRQVTPPTTRVDVDARATPLPCPLMAVGLREFESLGPRSWFCGTLSVTPSADGPSGRLVGEFRVVDLERLLADHLPHQISGTATVTVTKASFRGGLLNEADVTVMAGPGTVGRSLVEIAERLGIATFRGAGSGEPNVPFERLSVWLACNDKGLSVGAMSPSGTMLAGPFGAILSETSAANEPLPLAAVKRALAPSDESLISIARQPAWTTRRPVAAPENDPNADNPLR